MKDGNKMVPWLLSAIPIALMWSYSHASQELGSPVVVCDMIIVCLIYNSQVLDWIPFAIALITMIIQIIDRNFKRPQNTEDSQDSERYETAPYNHVSVCFDAY